MGLFKKKPTEFDQAQDKQLRQLMANQKVLLENNKYWLKSANNKRMIGSLQLSDVR